MSDKADYWLGICEDDVITAKVLLEKGRFLHMGYFCHLVAEKALKAVIAEKTNETPPKIHNLTRLAAIAIIFDELSEVQIDLLKRLTPLQIEARYPENKEKISATLIKGYCETLLQETEEFLCWIKTKLGK